MQRIQFAPDDKNGSPDAAKRLADRFGIPEDEVKKLLHSKQAPTPPPIIQETVMNTRDTRSPWTPIATLGALLGVVGILSLIVVIMMMMRHHHEAEFMGMHHPPIIEIPAPPVPPIMSEPTQPMPDSCCMPNETAEILSSKPTQPVRPKQKVVRKSGFQTSNSMEAEERLAELRAEGNTKAKITTTKKNGVLLFEVK